MQKRSETIRARPEGFDEQTMVIVQSLSPEESHESSPNQDSSRRSGTWTVS